MAIQSKRSPLVGRPIRKDGGVGETSSLQDHAELEGTRSAFGY